MPGKKINILIVDDKPQNLVAISAILADLNQNLICVSSAHEALRAILQYDFAVILLDVCMPDIDGFETARLIRAREKSSYIPIIFLSALNKEDTDINRGYAMGAVDYIFKPINPVILRSKVKVFIDLFTKSIVAIQLKNELARRERAEDNEKKQQHQLTLAESNRLSAMMEMTSAVAHELNQPLTTIANYVKGCIHRLNKGEYEVNELISALEKAAHQAERAGAILHRIKNFVRKEKIIHEAVHIHDLIQNVVDLIQEMLKEFAIRCHFKFTRKMIPPMLLDKIQIEQVMINLLRNSIEALQTHSHPKREIIIQTLLNPNKSLTIIFKDTGPGIAPQEEKQLFELYFTTKAQGMGMGLSISRTIIEAHGGSIIGKNNPKGGACFQINLPIIHHEHDKKN